LKEKETLQKSIQVENLSTCKDTKKKKALKQSFEEGQETLESGFFK